MGSGKSKKKGQGNNWLIDFTLLSKVNFTLLSKNIYFSRSSLQYYKVGLIVLSHRDVTCEALCALAVGLDKEVWKGGIWATW